MKSQKHFTIYPPVNFCALSLDKTQESSYFLVKTHHVVQNWSTVIIVIIQQTVIVARTER